MRAVILVLALPVQAVLRVIESGDEGPITLVVLIPVALPIGASILEFILGIKMALSVVEGLDQLPISLAGLIIISIASGTRSGFDFLREIQIPGGIIERNHQFPHGKPSQLLQVKRALRMPERVSTCGC